MLKIVENGYICPCLELKSSKIYKYFNHFWKTNSSFVCDSGWSVPCCIFSEEDVALLYLHFEIETVTDISSTCYRLK